MAARSGFQSHTTIHAAFWWYKPDPLDPVGREIMVEVNSIQYIEATQNHSKCWLYYASTATSSSERPYILEGPVAQAFLNDMEALF